MGTGGLRRRRGHNMDHPRARTESRRERRAAMGTGDLRRRRDRNVDRPGARTGSRRERRADEHGRIAATP